MQAADQTFQCSLVLVRSRSGNIKHKLQIELPASQTVHYSSIGSTVSSLCVNHCHSLIISGLMAF